MGSEEDTYNIIFLALKHPIRRRILRQLETKPTTFTGLLNELGIDNGLLNYHLNNLNTLITKGSDEKYRLSDFGVATLSLTSARVVFLGGLYFYSEKRGKALRGEGDFDADRKFDWLIIVWYLVWFYMWRHYGFWDENSYPGRYFFGFFMGFLVIAFVWFERNIFIDAWWRIVK